MGQWFQSNMVLDIRNLKYSIFFHSRTKSVMHVYNNNECVLSPVCLSTSSARINVKRLFRLWVAFSYLYSPALKGCSLHNRHLSNKSQ